MLRTTISCLLVVSLLQAPAESLVTHRRHGSALPVPFRSTLSQSNRRGGWTGENGLRLMSPMEDGARTRKRDRLKRGLAHRIRFSSSTRLPRSRSLSLSASKKDEGNNEEEKNNAFSNIPKTITAWKEEAAEKIVAVIPPKVLEVITNFWTQLQEALPAIKIGFASFAAGAALMLGAIFIPVYSSVEKLSEPVTLFETILADLDEGYVDEVDTKKLFETGISAMLNSLDPYTEFEAREDAEQLNEGIRGKYGGVGLVISGTTPKDIAKLERQASSSSSGGKVSPSKLLPQDAIDDSSSLQDGDMSSSISQEDLDEEDFDMSFAKEETRAIKRAQEKGIRVVSAFEGYAFDYGMRVGDKIVAVDDTPLNSKTSVEDVRNMLRGDPGTIVSIKFEREGTKGVQEVTMPRTVVRLRDVKLATLVGDPKDCIGYVSLTGFSQNAGPEMRQAIFALERAAEEATNGESSLKGLILDLRGNPGGLLTSAVEVTSLLVPKGSDIVSAKGRGFPGVLYRSRVDPILESNTKLAVLVNRGTASAAEIVSGAIQDLDAGVIIGTDRTFGKGLVQNVEDLPFNTALKFTVAKYYTPSGRCIQGVKYAEGGKESDGKYKSSKVQDRDRQNFYTRRGRIVKDGGGIEADYKVAAPKASALEVTLLRSDVLSEFAARWSRQHELNHNFEIDSQTYKEFQDFVLQKQKAGEIKLEALYSGALNDLQRALKQSGYKGSEKDVDQLRASIVREIQKDFERYSQDIKEDISNSILARYVPESMLLMRGLKTDKQVEAATRLINNNRGFNSMLAKGSMDERIDIGDRINVASVETEDPSEGARLQVRW